MKNKLTDKQREFINRFEKEHGFGVYMSAYHFVNNNEDHITENLAETSFNLCRKYLKSKELYLPEDFKILLSIFKFILQDKWKKDNKLGYKYKNSKELTNKYMMDYQYTRRVAK